MMNRDHTIRERLAVPVFALLVATCFLFPTGLKAQFIDQLVDFFTVPLNQSAVAEDSSIYPARIIITPLVAFSPETSIEFGAGAKTLFKFRRSGPETRTSNIPISLTYTLNNQAILWSGYEVFFNQERWMLIGNLTLQLFPQLYYGLGRNSLESNEEEYTFTQVLIEPILLKQIGQSHLFLGAGIRYNHVGNLRFEDESRLQNSGISGATGSTSVGAQLALVYDSRDNILTAHTGWFAQLTHGFYEEALGGTHRFQLTRLDLRKFISLGSPRRVLAFQLMSSFSFQDVPLNELSALGGGELMRGYYEGRFIDNHLVAFQAEYRFPLWDRFGGVVFAGAGDVARRIGDFRLDAFRPSVGFGLRFLIDRTEDLNLRFDYGFGKRTSNYYANVAEAF